MPRVRTETDCILVLPQREQGLVDRVPWAQGEFFHPDAIASPRPKQAEALWEMSRCGGLFGMLGVGSGKTLIAHLAPRALGVSRAVLFLPHAMLRPHAEEVARYADWGVEAGDATVRVLSYNTLSDPRFSEILDEWEPQAIIADEAHNLRNPNATRTRRFLRYMAERPTTKFVCMSGTMFGSSIRDAAHLARLALRSGSPIPSGPHLALWSRVLDEGGVPTSADNAYFDEVVARHMGTGGTSIRERARRAVHARIVRTEGVISTTEPSCTVPLTVEQAPVRAPEHLQTLSERVLADWTLPDGTLVTNPWAAAKNILTGFYYTWADEPDPAWLEARGTWARALRDELASGRARADYDSPALVERTVAAEISRDPSIVDRSFLHWALDRWRVHDRRPPPTRTVWLDEYIFDELPADEERLLWYSSDAIEQGLLSRGWTVHGAGSREPVPGTRTAASIRVHGTGKNLQAWSRAAVIEPPSSGVQWEQLLGRLHRPGQMANSVHFLVYVLGERTDAVMVTATRKAAFLRDIQGQSQRLLEGW